MPELIKGVVAARPKFFIANTEKKTPILKFTLLRDNDFFKRVPVVVFGKLAQKHSDLAMDQRLIVSGKYEENTFNGTSQMELKISDWAGNIKLVGEKVVGVPNDEETEIVEAVCPDFDFPDPTDEDHERDTFHWDEPFPHTGGSDDD